MHIDNLFTPSSPDTPHSGSLRNLRNENLSLHQANVDFEAREEDHRAQIAERDARIEELQSDLNEANSQIQQIQSKYNAKSDEYARLWSEEQKIMKERDDLVRDYQDQVEQSHSFWTRLLESNDAARKREEELEEKEWRLEMLEDKLERIRETLREKDQDIEVLKLRERLWGEYCGQLEKRNANMIAVMDVSDFFVRTFSAGRAGRG